MQKPVVNVMVKAARAAGNVLLRGMHKLDAINVVEKDRMDFASEMDEEAEKAAIKELRRAHPDFAILGEESGMMGKGHSVFVIDPLDGTSNYLRGFPHWCVSIALVEGGDVQHGVIFDPLRNELFTASRGSGAVLNDKRIRVSERKDLAGAMLITGFPPRERERAPAQLDCLRGILQTAEDFRRTGSAATDRHPPDFGDNSLPFWQPRGRLADLARSGFLRQKSRLRKAVAMRAQPRAPHASKQRNPSPTAHEACYGPRLGNSWKCASGGCRRGE